MAIEKTINKYLINESDWYTKDGDVWGGRVYPNDGFDEEECDGQFDFITKKEPTEELKKQLERYTTNGAAAATLRKFDPEAKLVN